MYYPKLRTRYSIKDERYNPKIMGYFHVFDYSICKFVYHLPKWASFATIYMIDKSWFPIKINNVYVGDIDGIDDRIRCQFQTESIV